MFVRNLYLLMDELPKRKRPSRNEVVEIHGRSNILFVTVAAKVRVPTFNFRPVQQALVSAWMEADFWRVGRYVIMPDHIHVFCAPGRYPSTSLRPWVKYWKRLVSESGSLPSNRDVWLRDCWDTQMRTGKHYTEKWEYVRQNSVRAGLVKDPEAWPFRGEVNLLDWR
jgi:REP element-mobilizing transposase RayT